MNRYLCPGAALLGALLCSACATVASGGATTQGVTIQTVDGVGSEVPEARCELSNDEGRWFVTTPGTATVHRSNKDLQVLCKKEGVDTSSAQVVSRTKGSIWGNILLGGGVGAIIDHNNGSAYEYPAFFKMVMGEHNVKIDDASLKAKQAAETTAKDAKAEVPAAVSGSK